MLVKKHKSKKLDLQRKTKIIILLNLIIFSCLGPYVGFFLYAMEEYNINAYQAVRPNQNTFVPANNSRLYAMAMWFEHNINMYHTPHDMVMNTQFNSSKNPYLGLGEPTAYSVSYDSAEWSGHYLMGLAYRYRVHLRDGNITLANHALGNITKVLRGFDKIIHVSGNGGMARYAWLINEYPGDYLNIQDPNHYRAIWKGQEYVFEDDTSRDMHNGVIMGLGMAYHLVNDTTIRASIKLLVEDLLDYFLLNGWNFHKPNDDPNGTDLDAGFWLFGTSGIWTLAYLKVGVLVNPVKYGPIYTEYAIQRNYVHRAAYPAMSRTNLVQAYYGLLLDWELLYVLITLETDTALRTIYMDYIKTLYEYTKYDRTSIFSCMWLVLNGTTLTSSPNNFVIRDIVDCLSRYYNATNRFPGRSVNLTNDAIRDPISVKWVTFFKEGIGAVLYPFWKSIYQFEIVANQALTPDFRPQTDFLWSRSPYQFEVLNQDGMQEGPGTDYVVVYWMARYHGIIGAPSNFNAKVYPQYPGD